MLYPVMKLTQDLMLADHQREMLQRAGTSNAFADLAAQTLGYVKSRGDAAEFRMILDNCGCLFDRLAHAAMPQDLSALTPHLVFEPLGNLVVSPYAPDGRSCSYKRKMKAIIGYTKIIF